VVLARGRAARGLAPSFDRLRSGGAHSEDAFRTATSVHAAAIIKADKKGGA